MSKIDIQYIDELLKFLPIFAKTDKFVSEVLGGKKNKEGVFIMPYLIYTKEVEEFSTLVCNEFWTDYNYLENVSFEQINDDIFISNASLSQIKSLLTFYYRRERFSEGHRDNLLKNGKIKLILERLSKLRKELFQEDIELTDILNQAKTLAKRYKAITGKPLGITGEVAEFTAAKVLNLKLMNARQTGYDAIKYENNKEKKVQIKGRCISNSSKSGRLGKIRLDAVWDSVLLVLLNDELDLINIYSAERVDVENAIKKPGSKSRNERGALSISQFISISKLLY